MERIKEFPNWIKGAIGFVTAIIGFIVLVLSNVYLGITISVGVILVTIFCLCLYLALSKKDSEIIGGGRIYSFPKAYRYPAFGGIVIIPIVSTILLINQSSRSFAMVAFVGTATFTPTATTTPTLIPTSTSSPSPTVIATPNATPTSESVAIEKLLLSKSNEHYRLEATIHNRLGENILVGPISLLCSEPVAATQLTPASQPPPNDSKLRRPAYASDSRPPPTP